MVSGAAGRAARQLYGAAGVWRTATTAVAGRRGAGRQPGQPTDWRGNQRGAPSWALAIRLTRFPTAPAMPSRPCRAGGSGSA
jgi:hypothetical protein